MMGSREDVPGAGFRIWTDLYFVEVLDPKSLEPVEGGRDRHAGGHRAADQQRHAVPALELGRPRHLQRGRRRRRVRSRSSRASSTRTAPPASSRCAASTSATRTSRTSSSATTEIGDFRAEALNEGGNDFLSSRSRCAAAATQRVSGRIDSDQGEVRADAAGRGARDRHAGEGVRGQRQGRAVRRPPRLAFVRLLRCSAPQLLDLLLAPAVGEAATGRSAHGSSFLSIIEGLSASSAVSTSPNCWITFSSVARCSSSDSAAVQSDSITTL